MKKVLITGGLGYVGGRLSRHLAQNPGLDITMTSRREATSPWPSVKLIRLNPTVPTDHAAVTAGMDAVIHLAALNEMDCVQHPFEAIDVNIGQTLKWLQAAEKNGVEHFIYFSTIHIYGSPLTGVITEENLPRPTHPYSITHRAAEDYVLASRKNSPLNGIVLRLTNSIGAPVHRDVDRWTLLVNDLCRQCVEKRQMTLHSDGSQERDFIPLSNVSAAVEHMLGLSKQETSDGIFNLGGAHTMSVYEMAELIADRCETVLGFRPPLNRPRPLQYGMPHQLLCPISKLESTGFQGKGSIRQEIDDLLRFCSINFEAINA